MSDINVIENEAKEFPKPIKEEQIHQPIKIKEERDLMDLMDGIETPIYNKFPKSQSQNDGSSLSYTKTIETNKDALSTLTTVQKEVLPATVKSEIPDNMRDEFLDSLLEDVEGIVKAAILEVNNDTSEKSLVNLESSLSGMDNLITKEGDFKKLQHKQFQQLKENENKNIAIVKNEPIAHSSNKTKKSENKHEKSKVHKRCHSTSPHHQKKCTTSKSSFERSLNKTPPIYLQSEMSSKSPLFHRRELFTNEISPSSSFVQNHCYKNKRQNDSFSSLPIKRIKLGKEINNALQRSIDIQPIQKLTPQTKRDQAIMRASRALAEFKKEAQKNESNLSSIFIYTPTVRKLPTSNSFITQKIYDNRSPLHTIKNVFYEFSSNANRINLYDWGMKSLPRAAAKVARILGIDGYTLYRRLLITKLPSIVRKIEREEEPDEVDQPLAVLYKNAMTQTDATQYHRQKTLNIGIQTLQTTQSTIASQTDFDCNIQMPLASLLQDLNNSQIIALNDFAELLLDPGNLGNDIYQLRQRLLNIYKTASDQPPIAIQPSTHPTNNNHVTMQTHVSSDAYVQQQIQPGGIHKRIIDPRCRNKSNYSEIHQ